MVKANEISVDGKTLATIVMKAIREGRGRKWVAEQTGLKVETISQRLKTIKELYPTLAEHLTFPKGKGVGKGKSVTRIDKESLSELEAMIAKSTGNVDPATVREVGMALVQGENITAEQKSEIQALQSQVDINAPAGVGVDQLQVA